MTSQILRTDGLVLRNLRYGDTSRVATLLTAELGKISVIGKGVREPTSPLGSSLELFARSEFVVYFRSGRNLQMLKSGDVIEPHSALAREPFRFVYGSAVVEFVDRMLLEEEPSPPLYSLVLRVLARIETVRRSRVNEVFRAFQLRAASILGYALLLDGCLHCDRSLDEAVYAPLDPSGQGEIWLFRPSEGGALCAECARLVESGYPLTVRALLRIRSMVRSEPGGAGPGAALLERLPAAVRDESLERPRVGVGEESAERLEAGVGGESGERYRASMDEGMDERRQEAEFRWGEALEQIVESFLHFHVERYRGLRSLRTHG
ncbi:MAG: DNA repair protein RecO [Candidatus Eisenbacteria bacterium]